MYFGENCEERTHYITSSSIPLLISYVGKSK
jgi:hypothetical protein